MAKFQHRSFTVWKLSTYHVHKQTHKQADLVENIHIALHCYAMPLWNILFRQTQVVT